jgi:hypothetical protein
VKSAIYCGHANESPQYEREGDRLICACPEDCYCKHDGGCRELQRRSAEPALRLTGTIRPGEHLLYREDRLLASCTSSEALEAARRLMSF